jgi:hypothetical protein
MTDLGDKRRGPDRRRFSRGGRRETDIRGYTPLIFVVDARPSGRDACEAILAKLRFAVAPFDSLEKAKRAMEGLKPDLVLVTKDGLDEMRRALPGGRNENPIPIVPLPEGDLSVSTLIDEVRRALRAGLGAIAES